MTTVAPVSASFPQNNQPLDLTFKRKIFDTLYRVCDYTPIDEISNMLASDTEGFFSDKYKVT